MAGVIAVLGTADTKGREMAYVRELIRKSGHEPILIDVAPLGPPEVDVDRDNQLVARLAGLDLAELIRCGSRERIMESMGRGAAALLLRMLKERSLDGVIGLGGNQGSAVSSLAMQALPIGFPKFLVSTVASGNIRPYVGHKDIAVMFSVSDILGGPNFVSTSIIANAVSALIGMVERGGGISLERGPNTVAVSALGNTQQAVTRAMELLGNEGYQVIPFHASGAGGSAMEELVKEGFFDAVLDLTPHELTEEVIGAGAYRPVRPGRLTAAGRRGIPQVVSLGGMDYLCFGPRESIPEAFRQRKVTMHNPYNANVKATRAELAEVGREMARRLNESQGPSAVLVPARGWSVYGRQGGPFHDPAANAALVESLKENLAGGVSLRVIETDINDPAFAESCVRTLLELMGKGGSRRG